MLLVGKFHGIGPATNAKMNALGIFTGLDLRKRDLAFLDANYGKAGAYYYSISRASTSGRCGPTASGSPSAPKTRS